MSTSTDDDIILCSNCGKGEESAGDLKACTACKMVKYCNRDCQIAHRKQHKKECKKRAAELHDEALFKQPGGPPEDCPICMLPLPSLHTGSKYRACCGKTICSGCIYAVKIRDGGVGLCPFCRTPTPTAKEMIEQNKKRMELGDAQAIYNMGCHYYNGRHGLPQDHTKALELWRQAAELGNATAYHNIGAAYDLGNGVGRDEKKAEYYYELAAMKGDSMARFNLGICERDEGNMDRALKHYMIAAGDGYNNSVKAVQHYLYKHGHATKDDYTKALLACQAYLEEVRSEQRDKATAFSDEFKCY